MKGDMVSNMWVYTSKYGVEDNPVQTTAQFTPAKTTAELIAEIQQDTEKTRQLILETRQHREEAEAQVAELVQARMAQYFKEPTINEIAAARAAWGI